MFSPLHFIMSVLAGYGLAVILVQKKSDWPIRRIHIIIKVLLHKIHWKLPTMLDCTVCTAFWATLIAQLLFGSDYILHIPLFHWLLTGFIGAAFTWTVMDFLNSHASISEQK